MNPTKEQIEKALGWFDGLNPKELPEIFFGQILAAAYREAIKEIELLKNNRGIDILIPNALDE